MHLSKEKLLAICQKGGIILLLYLKMCIFACFLTIKTANFTFK